MIVKTTQIPYSQLKMPLQAFINSQVEAFDDPNIFNKIGANRARYSKTSRPFIGYKKEDGSVFIETQYMSYLKATGMFYFIVKENSQNISIGVGFRLKAYIISSIITLGMVGFIMLVNYFINPKEPYVMFIMASPLILVLTIILPIINCFSARLKLYKGLVKRYDS